MGPRLRIALLALLLIAPTSTPDQGPTTFNSLNSGVNATVTITIGGFSGQRAHLYEISAFCSAGTAQLTVKDGVNGTTIWQSLPSEVTTTRFVKTWTAVPLDSTLGNGMDVVLSTCGPTNTGTLMIQADRG